MAGSMIGLVLFVAILIATLVYQKNKEKNKNPVIGIQKEEPE